MNAAYPEEISDGRGNLVKGSTMTHLAAGTMVSRDLASARKFYEDFLGLETVRVADDRLLIRDRRAKYLMENGERDFFVIEANQVEAVAKPQKMLNHWGLAVASQDEVRRLHAFAKAEKDDWYIKNVRPITQIHESYGFFIIDRDDNWWEIEHRGGTTNDNIFAKGDFDNRTIDPSKMVDPHLDIAETRPSILGPEAFMTHGTVDVADVVNARSFYEQVLGLRSVLRAEIAQFTAGGGDFTFVGVQVGGSHVADQTPDNRWILLVDDERQLAERHAKASMLKEHFHIRTITEPAPDREGNLSFLVESADSNWFEFSTRSRDSYLGAFERMAAA